MFKANYDMLIDESLNIIFDTLKNHTTEGVEEIFYYNCFEGLCSIEYFYKIQGKVIRHFEITDMSLKDKNKLTTRVSKHFVDFCRQARDVYNLPTHVKVTYNPKTGEKTIKLTKENLLDDIPIDICTGDEVFDAWFEEISNNKKNALDSGFVDFKDVDETYFEPSEEEKENIRQRKEEIKKKEEALKPIEVKDLKLGQIYPKIYEYAEKIQDKFCIKTQSDDWSDDWEVNLSKSELRIEGKIYKFDVLGSFSTTDCSWFWSYANKATKFTEEQTKFARSLRDKKELREIALFQNDKMYLSYINEHNNDLFLIGNFALYYNHSYQGYYFVEYNDIVVLLAIKK